MSRMYKREMAQFKEYSKKDFLYSGKYTGFDLSYCKLTDVKWDDLIQESCSTFAAGTNSIKINGKTYNVTTNSTVNTIREIALEFTKKTPYNFSYKLIDGKNYLIIDAAKITFNVASTKSASVFLGYSENGISNKLPYTLPETVKITANTEAASQYVFDSSYNMSINDSKVFDIRAVNGSGSKIYFDDKALVSGTVVQTDKPYINNIQLVQHLNKKMVGYDAAATADNRIGKCFYRFDYDYNVNKLIISDLVLYDVTTTATESGKITLTIKVKNTIVNGSTISETSDEYTYEITKPSAGTIKAESANDVIEDANSSKFRKFDYTSDTNNSGGVVTYNKLKIVPPTVKQKMSDSTYGGSITGIYTNGIFVCDLCNTSLPSNFVNPKLSTFKIAFDSISGNPIVMCSGSKYVKTEGVDECYYTLPYTKNIDGGNSAAAYCETAKRNKSLCDNNKSAQTIIDKTSKHPGFNQQYIDAKGFSDMSVLNIINLGIGIVAAAFFIAKTYK